VSAEPPVAADARRSAVNLADFSITPEALKILPLALVIGGLAACVALGLLDLIGLITHLAYYQDVGVSLVAPTTAKLGAWTILIPVVGGLIIGAMAYFGSERIRGHGIPEAMETILVGGSKTEPRLTILKPISSAVSIGTGGPFGAEGPIILTGGALGSVLAQFFHLSAIERRTLLVAGSCAGMAAVFGTPVGAVLFGVELLVFELKPRSLVPIALAVAVASVVRDVFASHHLMQAVPLFPVPPHGAFSGLAIAAAAGVGVASGLLAWVLTNAVYGMEDAFGRLPIHWAWWPALGGVVVGVGGLIDPRALGVGYATIGAELSGKLALESLALLLVVKLVIWSVALGSGTSGGILAPLLMMGAALGGILGSVLPGGGPTWALLGMAGALAGVTRSPLTSIVFTFELTHDTGSLLPLLVTCAIAHLISTLILKRSILTEKVARKGFHVVREYSVDSLEALFVREVMDTDVVSVGPNDTVVEAYETVAGVLGAARQHLVPVVDGQDRVLGAVDVGRLDWERRNGRADHATMDLVEGDVGFAHPDEPLRAVADRMAEQSVSALLVVTGDTPESRALVGVLTVEHLLAARQHQLVQERQRERPLRLRGW
jgi:H+/Cl- antiporter ClcA/predicted transcriptional regulator